MFITFFHRLFDLILPRSPFERELDTLTLEEFIEKSGGLLYREYDHTLYLFDYKNEFVRASIHSLKYHGNTRLAHWYATLLYEALLEETPEKGVLLIPIPMSKKKIHIRGWNQCLLIVDAFKKIDEKKHFTITADVLYKKHTTESQARTKSRKERLLNIKNSFGIRYGEKIYKENVVLFDDVITTGSTLREAENTLARAKVRCVKKIALAH